MKSLYRRIFEHVNRFLLKPKYWLSSPKMNDKSIRKTKKYEPAFKRSSKEEEDGLMKSNPKNT
jgi:hypothetical protein